IAFIRADLLNAFLAKYRTAVAASALADAAKRAQAASFPSARHDVHSFRVRSRRRLATLAHHREQTFNAVNPIPIQIGMSGFERAGAIRIATEYCADRSSANPLCAAGIAQ